MACTVSELGCKEIINIRDGARLGFVSDVVLELPSGKVTAIVAPGRRRFFGLFGREDDYIIPWECIRRIGDDIILIDVSGPYRREKPRRCPW